MNNHQKSTFQPVGNFLNPALALLGLGLRKSPNGQKLNSANNPYLCKALKVRVKTEEQVPFPQLTIIENRQ